MQKFLRSVLISALCALSLLSSSGAGEALHEHLHSLTSSTCPENISQPTDKLSHEQKLAARGLAIDATAVACPLQSILQASLGHSVVLPSMSAVPATPPIASAFGVPPFAADFISWNTGWNFSRGPPAIG